LEQNLQLSWRVSQATTLRLQQWLGELGYLPVTWTPTAGVANPTTWGSAYQPPTGSFSWRFNNTPTPLANLWQSGWWNVITQGAVMQFEHQHGLTVDGIAGPQVWTALQAAVLANQVNSTPYSYVYVTETQPETLWLWQNGQVVLTTKVNTGVTGAVTKLGTHPVYERLPFQVMKGQNPNGQSYADPVSWINYFWGSDAVHGFTRAAYGFPQSAGCVELPPTIAQQAYLDLHYGALVTVMPAGSPPLVPPSSQIQGG
jgi:peptidoglycan hydrolase-like protein with peptidoglycan-binding domain